MKSEEQLMGTRIKNLRKEKKMSQEELASKLGISRSYLTKIENGQRGLSIEIMQKLCKVFNITMEEFFGTGEEKDNYLEKETKRYGKRVSLFHLVTVIMLILMVLFILLSIYFFNNFNKIRVYILNGSSATFTYTNGIFAESRQKFILKSGTFDIKNENIKESDIINVEFKIDGELIMGQNSFFTGINVEDYSYDKLFTKKGYKNSKFTVDITYKLDNKEYTETMNIAKDLAISNNKLIYPKSLVYQK